MLGVSCGISFKINFCTSKLISTWNYISYSCRRIYQWNEDDFSILKKSLITIKTKKSSSLYWYNRRPLSYKIVIINSWFSRLSNFWKNYLCNQLINLACEDKFSALGEIAGELNGLLQCQNLRNDYFHF